MSDSGVLQFITRCEHFYMHARNFEILGASFNINHPNLAQIYNGKYILDSVPVFEQLLKN